MAGNATQARITALLEQAASDHGLELVAVEVAGSRAPTIRVYLDRPGGIDLDALAEANRWISAALDGADPVAGAYTLEVSSPGIERPLFRLADYERFVGSEAHVRTATPIGGRSRFTGTILGAEGGTVLLETDGTTHRLTFESIARARLKVDIDLSAEEGNST